MLGAVPAERLLRATRALKLGDHGAAMRLLSAETQASPDSFLAYDLRAAACLAAGQFPQALEDALRCTALAPEWCAGLAEPAGVRRLFLRQRGAGSEAGGSRGRQRAALAPCRRAAGTPAASPPLRGVPQPVPPPATTRRARGWARLGAANLCLDHARAALSAYERGLTLSPGNEEMQRGTALARERLATQGGRRKAQHH